MSEGYLYTAYGNQHIREAFKSLESLREADPDAHVTLVTSGNTNREYDWPKFNRVITSPHLCSEFLGGKVERMHSFYDKTIYLDTDTWICQSPRPLFSYLDHYDLAVAPDPGEIEVEGFVAPNNGVVAFASNPKVEFFLSLYREYYFTKELWKGHPGHRQHTDQPAFALAMRDSDVRALAIPQNWNARYRFSCQLNPGRVKIIHGLDTDFTKIQEEMDVHRKLHRCWNPETLKIIEITA